MKITYLQASQKIWTIDNKFTPETPHTSFDKQARLVACIALSLVGLLLAGSLTTSNWEGNQSKNRVGSTSSPRPTPTINIDPSLRSSSGYQISSGSTNLAKTPHKVGEAVASPK